MMRTRTKIRIATCVLCLWWIGNTATAQTIVNVERLAGEVDSSIFAVAFQYSGTSGNANTSQFELAPAIVFIRKKNDYKLFGGYSLLSEGRNSILNSGFVHARHNYNISKRIKTFEFYQLQFNEVLLLTKREVIGGGLRFAFTNSDSLDFDLGIGLMHELEKLNREKLLPEEKANSRYLRLTVVNNFNWIATKLINLYNVVYYQPRIKDFSDFRLLNDFSLSVVISKHLELLITNTTRYDSQPPGKLKNIDHNFSTGLNVKF